MHTGFWCGNLKDRNHLEDLGAEREIRLELILNEMEKGNVDWIFLDHNRGIKRVVSNVVTKCQVP